MKVINSGHVYELTALDGGAPQTLTFVKREGAEYPGNVGHHGGVIVQEVLRALIDRLEYANKQIPCAETTGAISALRESFYLLEKRAARRHGRLDRFPRRMGFVGEIETAPVHDGCGHIGCRGDCGRGTVQP